MTRTANALHDHDYRSSAGNTRGLIEASGKPARSMDAVCHGLPRGIPAASLKPEIEVAATRDIRGSSLPRGIPAASLKRRSGDRLVVYEEHLPSSAGNTRGLIEAWT